MGIVCVSICALMVFVSYYNHRRIYHPVVSFSFLFFLIMLLNVIGAYSLYPATDKAYILITLGVISFFFGSALTAKKRVVVKKNSTYMYKFNDYIYYVMILVCLLIIVPRFITIVIYLLGGHSIGEVYVTLAASAGEETGDLAQSGLQSLLMQFVGYPLLYILVPTSVVLFFKKIEIKYLLISLGLATMRVLLDSRRTYLISYFIFLLIAFLIHRNEKEWKSLIEKVNKKKFKRKMLIVLVIGVAFLFYFMTKQRGLTQNKEISIFNSFYCYYAGSANYFGESINRFSSEYTWGFTTLRGLFSPFFGILKLIGVNSPHLYNEATNIVNGMKYVVVQIGPNIEFNSFTTCFYQFYCDGGVLGIIILSFMFGAFAQSLYKRFIYDDSLRYEIKYIYFYGTILMLSFTNMLTIIVFIVWPLIIDRLLYNKVNNSI